MDLTIGSSLPIVPDASKRTVCIKHLFGWYYNDTAVVSDPRLLRSDYKVIWL